MAALVGLIIPDPHEQIRKLKGILALPQYKDLWVVFLGDFMDTFDGFTSQTHETIQWLRNNLSNPKYTFLWGNHDVQYAFPIDGVMCSGFDPKKLNLVRSQLNYEEHWKKFKLLTWIGVPADEENVGNTKSKEWLVSHAGLHASLMNPFLGFEKRSLLDLEDEALYKLCYCQTIMPFIAAGRGRGGSARVGGVDWLDWDREFMPINGLNQIVGHSNGAEVRMLTAPDSINYCVDTHLRHVVEVYDDGSIKIVQVNTLKGMTTDG